MYCGQRPFWDLKLIFGIFLNALLNWESIKLLNEGAISEVSNYRRENNDDGDDSDAS